MKLKIQATMKEGYVAPKEDLDKLSGHAAGVCYMPQKFDDLISEPEHRTFSRADRTRKNQHHSVFDHAEIMLSLEDIPKGLAMVLNNEKYYTTSEKSARYKKMVLKENEQILYNKWLDTFKNLIKEKYQSKCPQFFTDEKIEQLAQENARYLISVFTPTTMVYTTSIGQLNRICRMMENEIKNPDSNAFMSALKPAMQEFCSQFKSTGYGDEDLARSIDIKNRKLSLIASMIEPEQYFNYPGYSVSYQGSFAQLAQAQRHRTLDCSMSLLDEPKFFVPPILKASDELISEWQRDIEKQASVFPQGMLININESGSYDNFILKMKERKCTCAQLEINQQTDLILQQYINSLKAKNHPLYKELLQYSKGSRCTFPDYKCETPCGFVEGINGTREI